jgi:hypothetical protein
LYFISDYLNLINFYILPNLVHKIRVAELKSSDKIFLCLF